MPEKARYKSNKMLILSKETVVYNIRIVQNKAVNFQRKALGYHCLLYVLGYIMKVNAMFQVGSMGKYLAYIQCVLIQNIYTSAILYR